MILRFVCYALEVLGWTAFPRVLTRRAKNISIDEGL